MLIPRVPPWAVAAGVPPPVEGEGFEEFCQRIEIPEWVAADLVAGLDERRMEVANARLASYFGVTMPEAFNAAVGRLNGGREPTLHVKPPEVDQYAAVLSERYS